MVRVVLELDIVDQVMLENVLRALRLTTFKDGRDDTWMHENLKEGKRYKAGEKEGKRKRKHASGISKATPRKQIKVQPSQQRGPLQLRHQQQKGAISQAYDASTSMLMTTVSTHVQLEHNDTFAWAWGLSSEKRAEYMHTTKALAKIRFKEQKVRAAGLRAVRSAKAQAEFDAAQASIERKEDGGLLWLCKLARVAE